MALRLAIYRSGKDRCRVFAARAAIGAEACGWTVDERCVYAAVDNLRPADASVVVGVKRAELHDAIRAGGSRLVYVDKGYTREAPWRRAAVDSCEPTAYLGLLGSPPDRRRARGWEPQPWRASGCSVLLMWHSEREAAWRGLPPPEEHADSVVAELRRHTDRPIVYRPRPNLAPARSVLGAETSPPGRPLAEDLAGAHVAVTVGGSASMWALIAGVPCVCLGDAVAEPVSSTSVADAEDPRLATDDERERLLNDLAYCQWHHEEWRSGKAWRTIVEQLR
jgi:hypothetical protein